ncbi:hypothetical protein [Ensifer aridi]|uniref:hypothetical protein n=1 Tax=Ensifer aridi TaxID=1708715 RepID=UPI001124E098|nr:hypothetical protein [Ensifer aridi]
MTPAVKLALAYAYITDALPAGIHMATWREANKLITHRTFPNRNELAPEALEAIKNHPMIVGHEWLTAQGFVVANETLRRRTSHYIRYDHADGRQGGVGRGGSVWIRKALYNEGGVFLRNKTDSYSVKDGLPTIGDKP